MASQQPDPADETRPELDPEQLLAARDEAARGYGRFNLAVVGGTGVGKSSLINAVFGRDLAKVGRGLPVTAGLTYYSDDSLGIWDSKGFEVGAQAPIDALKQDLATIAERPADEQIAVVWYCVLPHATRLTSADVAAIRSLDAAGLPVIVVLTKVDWTRNPLNGKYRASKDAEEFRDWLENAVDENDAPLDLPIQRVILTSTRTRDGKDLGHGLSELVTATLAVSPKAGKNAFRIAQRLSLPLKRDLARPVIGTAAASAAAAAAVPIPVADAVALAPIQLAMMGRIAAIYDLDLRVMLSASTLAQIGVQIAGRAAARSLIKLIPGAGSVVSAGVAAALTAAAGEGWLRLCEKVHTGELDLNEVSEHLSDYLPGVIDVLKNLARPPKAPSA